MLIEIFEDNPNITHETVIYLDIYACDPIFSNGDTVELNYLIYEPEISVIMKSLDTSGCAITEYRYALNDGKPINDKLFTFEQDTEALTLTLTVGPSDSKALLGTYVFEVYQ